MAKIGIFGKLLQGSHTTILCHTSTGNILPPGLLVHPAFHLKRIDAEKMLNIFVLKLAHHHHHHIFLSHLKVKRCFEKLKWLVWG